MNNQITSFLKKLIQGKYVIKDYNGHKIYLRNNNVDEQVYNYVFNDKYHRPTMPLNNSSPIILDLGVNIGLSVIDLKFLFPSAVIYGYELDKDNTNMALKNTAGLPNVFIHNIGIWYAREKVHISGTDTDAFKIDEAANSESREVITTTMNDIVKENKLDHIDFIKMDIEGAEYEVFRHDLQWLDITRQIKVEIHNGQHVFDLIRERLDQYGFITEKDTHHWSTLIGYKK